MNRLNYALGIMYLATLASCVPARHPGNQETLEAQLIDVQDLLTSQCMAIENHATILQTVSNTSGRLDGIDEEKRKLRIKLLEHQIDSIKTEVEFTRKKLADVHKELGH
jgi:hypothetical protein